MEPFFPTIFDVLHDGSIDRLVGEVPGDVSVHVGVEYLRERFEDEGDEIIVHLRGCTRLSYRDYDAEEGTTDLQVVTDISPGILSAEMKGEECRVFCEKGVLDIQCDDGSISLDSGRTISLQELLDVATAYWEEWEKKSKP